MAQISSLLHELELMLAELHAPVVSRLRPGLERGEIADAGSTVGLEFPHEVSLLYEWHNGAIADGSCIGEAWLFPGYFQYSLQEATARYACFRATAKREPSFLEIWRPELFPIFNDGGSGVYLAECGESLSYSRVFLFSAGEDTQLLHSSLSAMISTILGCLRRRAYFLDSEGFLDSRTDDALLISVDENPGIPFWEEAIRRRKRA